VGVCGGALSVLALRLPHALLHGSLPVAERAGVSGAAFHRENYNYTQSWAPDKKIVVDRPYDKATLTAYVDTCRAKAKEIQAEFWRIQLLLQLHFALVGT
jgi:hypothetical protein